MGSVSFGALVAQLNKINVLSTGSGNPGATNISRSLGRSIGVFVFILDLVKGFIPTPMIAKFSHVEGPVNIRLSIVGSIGILLDHSFSIFYNFRGGKGISSTRGGFLVIMPNTSGIGILFELVIFHATHTASIVSLSVFISKRMYHMFIGC
jgi:glycerol-3-phosphate acyltransferase PlsY